MRINGTWQLHLTSSCFGRHGNNVTIDSSALKYSHLFISSWCVSGRCSSLLLQLASCLLLVVSCVTVAMPALEPVSVGVSVGGPSVQTTLGPGGLFRWKAIVVVDSTLWLLSKCFNNVFQSNLGLNLLPCCNILYMTFYFIQFLKL